MFATEPGTDFVEIATVAALAAPSYVSGELSTATVAVGVAFWITKLPADCAIRRLVVRRVRRHEVRRHRVACPRSSGWPPAGKNVRHRAGHRLVDRHRRGLGRAVICHGRVVHRQRRRGVAFSITKLPAASAGQASRSSPCPPARSPPSPRSCPRSSALAAPPVDVRHRTRHAARRDRDCRGLGRAVIRHRRVVHRQGRRRRRLLDHEVARGLRRQAVVVGRIAQERSPPSPRTCPRSSGWPRRR